ncbi:hypothetical protein [Sediminicoccus sp. BL-A-41-H5]|uniref:hypothetical protein n=1 Tax=Sediminicoccus sp. BL-A-41-H5 TaxID=3421106 RepID=UPI003D6661A3
MIHELQGAILYVLAAFGMGFLLGPLREFVLAPAIGPILALALELPLLLGFCAWIAPRILRRCRVPPGIARLRLGLLALALLVALEFSLGVPLRGWDLSAWLAHLATPPGLVTLLGYLIFALIPRWVRT